MVAITGQAELRQAPQGGPPGRRHRPDVRAGHEVEHPGRAGRGDPRDRPQGVPRRDAREARPDPHRAAREPRRDAPVDDDARAARRPARTYFPEPTDEAIAHAADLIAASAAAARPRRQRRPPAARLGRSCGRSPAASTSRSRSTFMGKGAIDDRSHLSLMAVGLQARDHVLTGFDRADLVICVGYDLVEYAPAALEPGRPQADRPHRHPAGRGRRPVPARGRADRRHRRLAPAAPRGGPAARDRRPRRRRAPRGPRDPRPRRPPDRAPRATSRAGAATTGCPITPQRAIADLRAGARARRHRRVRRRRPQGLGRPPLPGLRAEHRDHLERLRGDGHLAARRDRGQARPPGSEGRRAVRRRRLPDEQPGARDREADRGERHGRRLARRRLRADRLEAAQRVRAAVRRRVRQPGLRRLRRVVRDRRVPAVVRGRPRCRRSGGRSTSTARRSSRSRSTTARTSA